MITKYIFVATLAGLGMFTLMFLAVPEIQPLPAVQRFGDLLSAGGGIILAVCIAIFLKTKKEVKYYYCAKGSNGTIINGFWISSQTPEESFKSLIADCEKKLQAKCNIVCFTRI